MTQNELRSLLKYDKDTGIFTWIKKGSGVKRKIAGSINKKGYIRIVVNQKEYPAHRLAWLYEYGYMPKEQIDHINHNRADNRICNLREVGFIDNQRNTRLPKRNKSGVIGVFWNERENRWTASIGVDNKKVHLGHHVEFSDAVNARKNAEVLYGFHKNHGMEIKHEQ